MFQHLLNYCLYKVMVTGDSNMAEHLIRSLYFNPAVCCHVVRVRLQLTITSTVHSSVDYFLDQLFWSIRCGSVFPKAHSVYCHRGGKKPENQTILTLFSYKISQTNKSIIKMADDSFNSWQLSNLLLQLSFRVLCIGVNTHDRCPQV